MHMFFVFPLVFIEVTHGQGPLTRLEGDLKFMFFKNFLLNGMILSYVDTALT